MLTVKVSCLPKQTEDELRRLHQEIVYAIKNGVPSQIVHSENDMCVLFPTDAMEYGLGSVIIVEITGVRPTKIGANSSLSFVIGEAVSKLYPKARVISKAPFEDPEKSTTWDSKFRKTPS